ncbi:MAG: cytochrome P450 [Pseudomonadota bacterium]
MSKTTPADFNLMEDGTRECPFPYLQSIREQQPVYFMQELGAYYVSRYEDVRYIKKHPEIFSNNIFELGGSRGNERNIAEEYRAKHGWARVSTLQRTDPPVHTSYRRLINHAFTVARVRKMTPYIETVVNDLLDTLIETAVDGRGQCDFVWDFAVPLPCIVIADQLGVPRERIWDLKRWSDAMLAPGGGFVDEAAALECGRQVVAAQQFFAEVIEARRQTPADDIITDLVHTEIKDPHTGDQRLLTMPELQDLLDQLLTGGNETTTNAIGSGLMLLLQRPGTIARMRKDPALIRNFVEESLRYETPVLHLWRVTTQDVRLGDVDIPQGSSVAVGYASANRDAEVFPDSEDFVIERQKAGAHLAFGSGPHHCPGAALARQEMYSTFTILLHRLRDIELVDAQDKFAHVPSSFLRGLAHLHIKFQVGPEGRYTPAASAY